MPTTSNFGWTTPADTDLVKDGAAAIRTLGNGIDTSLVDLKGGTTGQVLSKNSNTDLDFTWVAQDDSNAIQNAIVDAKGDLISATAADTPARLASSGVNGDVLTVDTSTATGLKWAAAAAGGSDWTVVNSGGTSLSGSTTTISGISGKSQIMVFVSGATGSSAGSDLYLRLNTDTGSNYNLYGAMFEGYNTYTPNYLTARNLSSTSTPIICTFSSNSSSAISGSILITGANSTNNKMFQYLMGVTPATSNSHVAGIGGGYYTGSSAITSISLTLQNGTFSAGTVLVYASNS